LIDGTMSETTQITVTSQRGLEFVNAKLRTQYDALIGEIRSRLSPDHALIFTRPEFALGSDRSGIAWFTDGVVNPVPISGLPAEGQALALQKLNSIEADLKRLAERLRQEGQASAELARLIEDALVRPPGETVWVIDSRPLLVNWGLRPTSDSGLVAERAGPLTGIGLSAATSDDHLTASSETRPSGGVNPAAPSALRPGSTTESASGSRALAWLNFRPKNLSSAFLWIIFACLLLGICDRLLRACAFGPALLLGLVPQYCSTTSSGVDRDLAGLIAQAQDDVRRSENALTLKAAACEKGPAQAPAFSPKSIPPGTRRGKLELSLSWQGRADLDLSVECGNGERNDYKDGDTDKCGAHFVLDVNSVPEKMRDPPVELIIWDPVPDTHINYKVYVTLWNGNGQNEIPFTVTLSHEGRVVTQKRDIARGPATQTGIFIFSFDLPLRPQ
jgi:hypothetical protein